MKAFLFNLLIPFSIFSATFILPYSKEIIETNTDLNRQLAAILTYPQVLSNRNIGGIVVIQFSLFDSNSIGKVKVFSENQELSSDLIRQLTGKKLYPPEPSPLNNYTAKLHFKVIE